ncbi:MAG: hypothetical protein M9890_07870 [Thermomicrobiales bacterium]|nr:hypothetical protein [Thermomicrobiales bacterium]
MSNEVDILMTSPPTTEQPNTERERRGPIRRHLGLLWIAFDIVVPTALLYVMLWRGSSLYAALLVSAGLSAMTALISHLRGGGRQSFAPQMLAMALVGFGLALITGSDRFLLAKESVLTSIAAFWFFRSLWQERPLTYRLTRPLMEGRSGHPNLPWEQLWEQEPRFRHIWRVSTVMWTVALLIDAALRVVMAYTLPVHSVPALQTGLMLVTVLVMQVVTNGYYMLAGLWPIVHDAPGARQYRPTFETVSDGSR